MRGEGWGVMSLSILLGGGSASSGGRVCRGRVCKGECDVGGGRKGRDQ